MNTQKRFHVMDRASAVLDAQLLSSATSGTFTISSLDQLGNQSWDAPAGYLVEITIDDEHIVCSAMSEVGGTATLTIQTRGADDTLAATHTAGTPVYIRLVKAHLEEIQAEVAYHRDVLDKGMVETAAPTITDANTHTIVGDVTATFTVGRVYLFKVGTTWHRAIVRSATYGAPNTTIEITGDSLPASGTIVSAGFELGSSANAPVDAVLVKELSGAPAENPPTGYNWIYTEGGALKMKDDAGGVTTFGGGNPTGSIVSFGGSSAPVGWLLCDGASLLRADYADLFAVIGTTYGSADGTHFNVPNMKGKVPVGYDSGETEFDALGETGGEKTHTLSEAEMPVHTHSVGNLTTGARDYVGGSYKTAATFSAADYAPAVLGNAGSGAAHNNLQPYITLNFIIKT